MEDIGNKDYRILMISVFSISIILRIALSTFNYQANDNHFEVIDIIQKKGIFPTTADCWEGFQPKMYYSVAAAISKICLSKIDQNIIRNQIRLSQYINCIAGIITICIVWLFLNNSNLLNRIKCILKWNFEKYPEYVFSQQKEWTHERLFST